MKMCNNRNFAAAIGFTLVVLIIALTIFGFMRMLILAPIPTLFVFGVFGAIYYFEPQIQEFFDWWNP